MQYKNHEILFSGKDLMATFIDANSNISVIIFNGKSKILNNGRYVPFNQMPIMANNVFSPIGINEVHIFPNRANWYQSDEIYNILNIVKSKLKHTRYITYGSSMGGFAAINFSKLLNCDFIAFSPQATLQDPFPISSTWEFAKKTYPDFRSMILDGSCRSSKGLLFFDYKNKTDSYHGMYIKRNTKAKIINIPFSNHETIRAINDITRVKYIVKDYLLQTFNLSFFKKNFFDVYKKTPNYIYHIYTRNKLYDIKAIKEALKIYNDDYKLLFIYGKILYNNKKYQDAYNYLLKSVQLCKQPSIINYIPIYNTLKKPNRHDSATKLFENLSIEHYARYGNLFLDYLEQGNTEKSDEYLLKALSLHPNKIEYMKKLVMIINKKKNSLC